MKIDMNTEKYLFFYLIAVSFVAVVLTVYDKAAAKKGKRRVSEKMLMFTGFSGGATAMYAVMQMIRHKTQHKKFMIGLPVFILLHLVAILFLIYS